MRVHSASMLQRRVRTRSRTSTSRRKEPATRLRRDRTGAAKLIAARLRSLQPNWVHFGDMNNLSEREKMLAGQAYDPADPHLVSDRLHARTLCNYFNNQGPERASRSVSILAELLDIAPSATIHAPFRCDYGYNLHIGANTYLNYDCVILDVAPVTIGCNVFLGPGVHLYAATHPMSAAERRTGLEFGRSIAIKDDVWIGGRSVICPGVTVGAGSVIGAGSVVTRDVPSGVFAAGNPCRVIRSLPAGADAIAAIDTSECWIGPSKASCEQE